MSSGWHSDKSERSLKAWGLLAIGGMGLGKESAKRTSMGSMRGRVCIRCGCGVRPAPAKPI